MTFFFQLADFFSPSVRLNNLSDGLLMKPGEKGGVGGIDRVKRGLFLHKWEAPKPVVGGSLNSDLFWFMPPFVKPNLRRQQPIMSIST